MTRDQSAAIDAAAEELRRRGAADAEVMDAINILTALAGTNPAPIRLQLARGVVVKLPGTTGAKGHVSPALRTVRVEDRRVKLIGKATPRG